MDNTLIFTIDNDFELQNCIDEYLDTIIDIIYKNKDNYGKLAYHEVLKRTSNTRDQCEEIIKFLYAEHTKNDNKKLYTECTKIKDEINDLNIFLGDFYNKNTELIHKTKNLYEKLKIKEKNNMEKEVKKTIWVTMPKTCVKDINFDMVKEDPETKEIEVKNKAMKVINVPLDLKYGRNDNYHLSFLVSNVVQHPQLKDYALVPIPNTKDGLISVIENYKAKENTECYKVGDWIEEKGSVYTQSELANEIKDIFKSLNKESTKFVAFSKSNFNFISKDDKDFVIVNIPGYVKEHNDIKLSECSFIVDRTYKSTQNDNVMYIKIDAEKDIKLRDNKGNEFTIKGDEFVKYVKTDYKEMKKSAYSQAVENTKDEENNLKENAAKINKESKNNDNKEQTIYKEGSKTFYGKVD